MGRASTVGDAIQDGGIEDNESTELQEGDLLLEPDGFFFMIFEVGFDEVVGESTSLLEKEGVQGGPVEVVDGVVGEVRAGQTDGIEMLSDLV